MAGLPLITISTYSPFVLLLLWREKVRKGTNLLDRAHFSFEFIVLIIGLLELGNEGIHCLVIWTLPSPIRPIIYEARFMGFGGLTFGTLAFVPFFAALLLPLSRSVSPTLVRTRLLPLLGQVVDKGFCYSYCIIEGLYVPPIKLYTGPIFQFFLEVE